MMMKMIFDHDAQMGDLSWGGKGLELDEGLYTMVLVSLLTDARSQDGDRLPLPTDYYKRGCWSDALARISRMRRGSRIWTLMAAKADSSAIKDAEFYANECLAWMVELGIVERVACEAWFFKSRLMLKTALYEPGNSSPIFEHIWEMTKYAA